MVDPDWEWTQKTTEDTVQGEPDSPDISSRLADLENKVSEIGWYNADDFESKLGNLEGRVEHISSSHDKLGLLVEEMEKKLNTIIALSKKFAGHIKDREIHLQDR